jgi:hypothetical protein
MGDEERGVLEFDGKGVRNDDGKGDGRLLVKDTKIPYARRRIAKWWKKGNAQSRFTDDTFLMGKLEKLLGLGRVIQAGILETSIAGEAQLLHRDISISMSNLREILIWNINMSRQGEKSEIIIGNKVIEMKVNDGVWFNSALMHAGQSLFTSPPTFIIIIFFFFN